MASPHAKGFFCMAAQAAQGGGPGAGGGSGGRGGGDDGQAVAAVGDIEGNLLVVRMHF